VQTKFAISSVALAIFIVLASGIIPHHHHDNGAICFFMTDCQKDNSTNGENAQDSHARGHNTTCVAEASYYTSSENEVKVRVSSCNNCDNPSHIHLFPLLYLVPNFLIHPAHNTVTKPKYSEYLLFYPFAEVNQPHGLRAPPSMLC